MIARTAAIAAAARVTLGIPNSFLWRRPDLTPGRRRFFARRRRAGRSSASGRAGRGRPRVFHCRKVAVLAVVPELAGVPRDLLSNSP